jgi:hypothetical protein
MSKEGRTSGGEHATDVSRRSSVDGAEVVVLEREEHGGEGEPGL